MYAGIHIHRGGGAREHGQAGSTLQHTYVQTIGMQRWSLMQHGGAHTTVKL